MSNCIVGLFKLLYTSVNYSNKPNFQTIMIKKYRGVILFVICSYVIRFHNSQPQICDIKIFEQDGAIPTDTYRRDDVE